MSNIPLLNVSSNRLDGFCPCGKRLFPGDGFWVHKLKQLRCEPCLQQDQELRAQHIRQQEVEACGAHIKVRMFWNDKKQLVLVRSNNLSKTAYESFGAVCKSSGFSYDREAGHHGSLALVPHSISMFEKSKLHVEVSDNLADQLTGRATQIKVDVSNVKQAVIRIEENSGLTMKPYQRNGVEWLTPLRQALLADDGGLGKGAQVLGALPPDARVVISAPKAMRGEMVRGIDYPVGGWADEIRKWRHDLTPVLLSGIDSFRWPEPGEVLLCNYEILPPTPVQAAKLRRHAAARTEAGKKARAVPAVPGPPPEGVYLICDEIHNLGNKNSSRKQRFTHLAIEVLRQGGRAWGVSATPIKNTEIELWWVLDSICLAEITFGSYLNYAKMHNFEMKRIGKKRVVWEFKEPTPEVSKRLSKVMLRRQKRDVLTELPPLTVKRVVIEVDKQAMKACDRVVRMIEEAGISLSEAFEIAADAATGVDFTLISKAMEAIARCCIPHALTYADKLERTGTPALFFAAHIAPVLAFADRDRWGTVTGTKGCSINTGGKKRSAKPTEVYRAFQNTHDIDWMAASIQSSGVGITLTRASVLVLVSKAWSPLVNLQAIWRMERIGQENPMSVIDFVANHPLALHQSEILEKKLKLFDNTINAAAVKLDDIEERVADPSQVFEQAASFRTKHGERTLRSRKRFASEAARSRLSSCSVHNQDLDAQGSCYQCVFDEAYAEWDVAWGMPCLQQEEMEP